MANEQHAGAYQEAQKRLRHAHDQAKHILEQIEHYDNANQIYPFANNDEHVLREYEEATKHFIEQAHNYFG